VVKRLKITFDEKIEPKPNIGYSLNNEQETRNKEFEF
jgi:hypothetical protein